MRIILSVHQTHPSSTRRQRQTLLLSYHHYAKVLAITLIISHVVIMQSLAEVVNHVTCGSVIKLQNEAKTKVRLHSHDIKYGSGSGQQSVTAAENQDTNSYWSILGAKNNPCNRGEPIECGSIIRLQHVQTRKFLHSHLFKSPLSNQQEVSAFGGDDESDTGDHWTVYCKSRYWQKNDSARLKHVDTEMWLSLSGNTYGRPIFGQLEVICSTSSDASSYWKTAEGVYVQPTTKSDSAPRHDELKFVLVDSKHHHYHMSLDPRLMMTGPNKAKHWLCHNKACPNNSDYYSL